MSLLSRSKAESSAVLGAELHQYAARLYPICRSITGDGLRKTLASIAERIPLNIVEVPTGTPVFDWTVPDEWNIRDAYIANSRGEKVVSFEQNNLHVMSYSEPVRARLTLSQLREHLFTLHDHPDWIPYRTSYYRRNWAFCLSHNQFLGMEAGEYEVCIDSTLAAGQLSYGEYYIAGRSPEEVLISCHVCHPSLANDNLSGLVVATRLAQLLGGLDLRYSYRFLFAPGTIGAITWLALHREHVSRVKHGLVLTGIGDAAGFHYKKSRRGDADIDRVMAHVLRHQNEPYTLLDFTPYGYDERQYCSPGFNLPMGCLMRSVWGTYPQYHTSADDLTLIRPESLARSLQVCVSALDTLERNRTYVSHNPFCEPQLGKRGLYRTTGDGDIGADINARLWVMNLCDGEHSLLDIAERSAIPFPVIAEAAQALQQAGLLSALPDLAEPQTVSAESQVSSSITK